MQPQQQHTLRPTGDRAAIQRDLERLDKWAKLHGVNRKSCTGLFLNGQYGLEANWIERTFAGVLGVLVDAKLNMSQQRDLVAKATNHILGYDSNDVESRSMEVITTLYSALVRPSHLKYSFGFCNQIKILTCWSKSS